MSSEVFDFKKALEDLKTFPFAFKREQKFSFV
jgi:hypothetical protein